MRRAPRGQAVTEVALGLLVLVPTLLTGIFLAESAMFRLEATEAATEPLWDATAYAQHQYEGSFVLTPGAIGTATSRANSRMRGRTMVYTRAAAPRVTCGGAGDMAYGVGGVPYEESGGISCSARVAVGARDLTRNFLDQGNSGFFKEPLANLRRSFDFCENSKCRPFKMSIGDWGLTNQGGEAEECRLTMDGCENNGFFGKARATYLMNNNSGGVKGTEHTAFMNALMNRAGAPADYDRVTDFQMSFQGETEFMESVPVIEGDRDWRTTPFLYSRVDSYNNRVADFLGRRR